MAEISCNLRNIVGSQKCAVSSSRIVGLEIGDASLNCASESVFQGIFLNDQVCRNNVKNNSNLICGCDKQSDKNFLMHSQSSLSTSTCDDRPSHKIVSTNGRDIDLDLLDLLNSIELERSLDSSVGNFNSKKTSSHDKMKIISNVEVCGGISDLLSSIAHDISENGESGPTFDYCQRKNARNCDNGLLDFEIVKSECADSVSSNNSTLKAEGNPSDLLPSINFEDSNATKVGSFNCRNMCNSKVVNKSEMEVQPPVADLSDLLSSIDLGYSNDDKVGCYNRGNIEVLEAENESCLADLLSSINIDNSNKPESVKINSNQDNMCNMEVLEDKNEECLADLLSSIDIDRSKKPDSAVINSNQDNVCNKRVLEAENESCLADLLSFINIDNSNKPDSVKINGNQDNMCNMEVLEGKNEECLADLLSPADKLNKPYSAISNSNRDTACNMEVIEAKNESCLADLLSSIDIDRSEKPDSAIINSNQDNVCNKRVLEFKNESYLADLLSSINIDSSKKPDSAIINSNPDKCKKRVLKAESESCLADLLSSIDIDRSKKPDSAIINSNKDNVCNKKVLEAENESCLADLLSSDIDKSNKPLSDVLNMKPLSLGSSNLYFKETSGISDSLDDFTFDFGLSSSSSNSCASSYSEQENNSPKDSSTKNNPLTDRVLECDSGYSSVDSADKGFSFFDFSSDNQLSFNTLLTKKSDASIAVQHSESENGRYTNEEMSMSDLMTIVSPEFKNSVLASLNKAEKHEGSVKKDSSSTQDLIECLSINDSHDMSNNSDQYDEKRINYDCVDGRTYENFQSGMETIDIRSDALLEKDDISINRNDDEQTTFIDLRECIKSSKHQFTPTSVIKQKINVENQSSECFSPNKVLFYCEDKSPSDSSQNKPNPFEYNDMFPRKKSRVNTKQTLFSKALACKPKKDPLLLQRVANIKNELLNNIIHRPVFIDCDLPQPIVESVLQSDKCILSNVGRRSFGLDAPCELQ